MYFTRIIRNALRNEFNFKHNVVFIYVLYPLIINWHVKDLLKIRWVQLLEIIYLFSPSTKLYFSFLPLHKAPFFVLSILDHSPFPKNLDVTRWSHPLNSNSTCCYKIDMPISKEREASNTLVKKMQRTIEKNPKMRNTTALKKTVYGK